MPSFSILIEDTSPVLRYSPGWTPGTSNDDSSLDLYTDSSFMKTNNQGDTMSFVFNGTGISIGGAKRGNHGVFLVNLDDNDSPLINGSSNPPLFQQTLFTSNNLSKGPHSVILRNEDSNFLDVDFVAIQVDIGEDKENLIVNTYQDMHPSFFYHPQSSWTTPDNVASFSDSSGRATRDQTATVKISFQVRDGIAVYGPIGPNMTASYSAQIDNGPITSFSANRNAFRAQQIMFFAVNIGPGSHILSMSSGQPGLEFAIDYANVFTTISLGGSFDTTSASASVISTGTCPEVSSHIPPGILVGFAITSAISFASICGFIYLFWSQLTLSCKPKQSQNTTNPFHIDTSQPSTGLRSAVPSIQHIPSRRNSGLQHSNPNASATTSRGGRGGANSPKPHTSPSSSSSTAPTPARNISIFGGAQSLSSPPEYEESPNRIWDN